MCELLALSSSRPARLTHSLRALASRGGGADSPRDGWGVALFQGRDVALFREAAAAADSSLVRYLESQGPAAGVAISHIRHATRGDVSLANTQPFVRTLGGRKHVFAHNGDLPGVFQNKAFDPASFNPVGQTDSEHAFCALLSRLSPLWALSTPTLDARRSMLAAFAADLRALGPANFIYSDGEALFAHGHRRVQSASGHVEPPGLWWLQRECASGPAAQFVLLLASVPLSSEAWHPLMEGELLLARGGRRVETVRHV